MEITAEMIFFGLGLGVVWGFIILLVIEIDEAVNSNTEKIRTAELGQWNDIRKFQDVQMVGAATRQEIDQVLACYRQQVDQILQAEQPGQPPFPQVMLFSEEDYKIINQ